MQPYHDDDDRPALRPIQAPRSATATPIDPTPAHGNPAVGSPLVIEATSVGSQQEGAPVEEEPRQDEGPGRPKQAPSQVSRITPEDWDRITRDQAREAEAERRRIEEELAADEAMFYVPPFLAGPLVGTILLALAALLGLFLFSQVTSTLAALSSLPEWLQYGGWVGLALLVALVLYAVGRFAIFYFGLRPNQPVRLKSLRALSQRTRLRRLLQERKEEARGWLQAYLQEYPLAEPRDRKVLGAVGFAPEHFDRLRIVREGLLDVNRFAGYDQWLSDFRTQFQGPLDEVADARVSYFARRVAVMTAASPNTLIDTLLTAYCSFSLLADLCRIYNLRVTRVGTGVILVRVFFNAYLAGQMNEFEGVAETGIQGLLGESGLHFGSVAMDAAAGKIVGKVGARAASGALNYFLLKRLGAYSARLLRPIQGE